jgi:hypothetical protein
MREVTLVVGARHMGLPALKACLELQNGAPLILAREPGNPHDANAIKLLDMFGRPVGYVQREVAAIVARWMDEGFLVSSKVIKAPNLKNGRMDMRLRYPRAAIYREEPPALEAETSFDTEDEIERHKEKVLERHGS